MNVSTAIKNAYKNNSAGKILNISFPDLDYDVPTNEVYYESMTLEEAIFDGDSFEVVGCIASQFEIEIRDTGENLKGEHIVVTISLEGIEDSTIPLFDGYVDAVDRVAQKKMQKITAYDALYSIGNTEVADWYNALTFPVTLKNLRDSLFTYIGITQQTTTLPNDNVQIEKEYNPNTLKAVNVIKAICQINGCFGMMDRQGTFKYRFLSTSGTAETVSYYRSMDYKDYVVNPIDKLTIRQSTDDAGVTIGSGDNQYIIQGNMFTYNLAPTTLNTIALAIYPYLSNIEYIPFEASNNGYPWIEVGDNCILKYSVYDFDNSTGTSEVYKDVTVVAFKRTMKGIQNLVDTYISEGKELQREFVSDVSVELDVLQQTIDNIIKNMSTEITTYRNSEVISIADGQTATIADLVYEADEGNTVLFHEEADLDIVATESLVSDIYTEGDVVGTVRYYVNGYRLTNHISEDTLREGKHILNLMQFWQAGQQQVNRVQAKLTVEGGSATIQKFRANSYITVKQSPYYDAAIEVTKMPNKTSYNMGETLNYAGIVVSKVYYDESKASENVTSQCVFSPTSGTRVTSTNLIEVLVTYTETNEIGETHTYETTFYLSTQYVTGIYVDREPNKTEYIVGNQLALAGIKVVADFADGTTRDVTSSCVYSPANGYTFQSENEGEIDIAYTDHGITVQTSTYVEVVQELICTGIEVTTPPNKVAYNLGDTLDYTGLVVTAHYNDGSSVIVTDSCTMTPANGSYAQTSISSVSVAYTYKSVTYYASFEISVSASSNEQYFNLLSEPPRGTAYVMDILLGSIADDGIEEYAIPDMYVYYSSGYRLAPIWYR